MRTGQCLREWRAERTGKGEENRGQTSLFLSQFSTLIISPSNPSFLGFVRLQQQSPCLDDFLLCQKKSRSSWRPMMESVCCYGNHKLTLNSKDSGMSWLENGIPNCIKCMMSLTSTSTHTDLYHTYVLNSAVKALESRTINGKKFHLGMQCVCLILKRCK